MFNRDINNIITKYLTINRKYHKELIYKTMSIVHGLDTYHELNKYAITHDTFYHWMILPSYFKIVYIP